MDAALSVDTTADQSDAAISDYIVGFETAERRLQQRFEGRQSTNADATEVLTRATYIDQFMSRNRLNAQTQAQWRNLKADLNTLATYYNVNWDWNQRLPSDTGSSGGGMVEVEANGVGEVLSVRIDPALFARGDREMIEDLLPAAINQTLDKVKQLHNEAMQSVTGGMDLPGSVAPFILRAVSLLGIDSVMCPQPVRREAWKRLATDLDRGKLQEMTGEIGLADVAEAGRAIVEGKVRGRTVVKIG